MGREPPLPQRGIDATAPGPGPTTAVIPARGGDRRASRRCRLRRPSARMTHLLFPHLMGRDPCLPREMRPHSSRVARPHRCLGH
jgi:hypothetical protein